MFLCQGYCGGAGGGGGGEEGEDGGWWCLPRAGGSLDAGFRGAAAEPPAGMMPARIPSRKLTPYPGKGTYAAMQQIELVAPGPVQMDGPRRRAVAASRVHPAPPASTGSDAESGLEWRSDVAECDGQASGRAWSPSKVHQRGRLTRAGSGGSGSDDSGANGDKTDRSGGDSGGSGNNSGDSGNTRGTIASGSGRSGSWSSIEIDWNRPPRSLLEASARRVAQHEIDQKMQEREERRRKRELRRRSKPANATGYFVQYFFEAVAAGDTHWASSQKVDILFADEDARMLTHDGGRYYGKGGILKRLNRGIESLLKMTGPIKLDEKPEDIYSIPGIQITGPLEVAPLKWKVTYAMKYNMNTFKFEDEFDLIDNGQIKTLTRRLLK